MTRHVDLWLVRTEAVDPSVLELCSTLLSAKEKTRHSQFVFEKRRREYLVTRGLARGVLAAYVGRPPRALSFFDTEHGRPVLEDAGDLRFNLTNTTELVACAVGRGREVGVDAEPLDHADEILPIAETVFTTGEREELGRLPIERRRRRAVELWTLKEAYLKARGLGLLLPVGRVEVGFGEGSRPTLRFFPPVEDEPARWAMSTVEIDEHLVSTCVEIESREDVEVRVRRADLSALLV
jgi:4'-phosphopantetheinyl transferase